MYKPETIETLKQFYEGNKTQLTYLKQYGTTLQKKQSEYIIKIAMENQTDLEAIIRV